MATPKKNAAQRAPLGRLRMPKRVRPPPPVVAAAAAANPPPVIAAAKAVVRHTLDKAQRWSLHHAVLMGLTLALAIGVAIPSKLSDLDARTRRAVLEHAAKRVTVEHPTRPGYMASFPDTRLLPPKTNVHNALTYWYEGIADRKHADSIHPGPPIKHTLSDQEVQACLRAIASGNAMTLKDLAANAAIKPVLDGHGMSIRYLIDYLRRLAPITKCMVLEYKYHLNSTQRAARVLHARGAMVLFKQVLNVNKMEIYKQIVWIDQKCIYISPCGKLKLWGIHDWQLRTQYGGPAEYQLQGDHVLRQVCAGVCVAVGLLCPDAALLLHCCCTLLLFCCCTAAEEV